MKTSRSAEAGRDRGRTRRSRSRGRSAEALEEAHEKGIVHRDLKPANVKVTPDGRVKAARFRAGEGMDRRGGGRDVDVDLTQSPTLAHTGTAAGIILGTAAYMSPEQAQGLQVDARSDVFSFGTVLYEMLTGRRDLSRATRSRRCLPPCSCARWTFRRCLAILVRASASSCAGASKKNPKRRWQAVGDLRAELEIVSTAPRAVPAGAGHAPRSVWRRTLPIALSALLSVLL